VLVYNTTMTNENPVDPNHVKTVSVYAPSSVAFKPEFVEAARHPGEARCPHCNRYGQAWNRDARLFDNVTPANA
jgi:hypothetical protein